MAGTAAEFRVAMRPGKRRALPDTPDGRLQGLIVTAKAHVRAKVEHLFRVIKKQFGFEKTRLRGLVKNRCKINVLAGSINLFPSASQKPTHNRTLNQPARPPPSSPARLFGLAIVLPD